MKEVVITQGTDGSFIVREVGNNAIKSLTTHDTMAKLVKRLKEVFEETGPSS